MNDWYDFYQHPSMPFLIFHKDAWISYVLCKLQSILFQSWSRERTLSSFNNSRIHTTSKFNWISPIAVGRMKEGMIFIWNVSIYWKLQNASEVPFFLRKNRGSANLPIQSEEAPSPGATGSEMATDILHSVYIMLKLFFILMMSIARRCHSEFIMRSFFTFSPDTRSYSSEED
jgi:hypothetical protein